MSVIKFLTVIGARPQFIKAASISRALSQKDHLDEIILHTGQHYDSNMSDVFFKQLELPTPDYNLNIGSGSHGYQTGHMLIEIEKILLKEQPEIVLVYGDTNSTVAGALAAVKLHIPVAHIEAGLRSFNKSMPEEINRICTDHTSDFLYAPTPTAMEHLKKEGLSEKSIFTGDVMLDSIYYYQNLLEQSPNDYLLTQKPKEYNLVTIHRPSNTDDLKNLKDILKALGDIDELFIFPAHPRVRKTLDYLEIRIPNNVEVLPPVGYLEMITLIKNAKKVFTDSGGLQKEAFMLSTPCVTLRDETEWTETLDQGWNILTGSNPDKIIAAANTEVSSVLPEGYFGDGNAASLIVSHLEENLQP